MIREILTEIKENKNPEISITVDRFSFTDDKIDQEILDLIRDDEIDMDLTLENAFFEFFEDLEKKLKNDNEGYVSFIIEKVTLFHNLFYIELSTFEVLNREGDFREATKQEIDMTLKFLKKYLRGEFTKVEDGVLDLKVYFDKPYPIVKFR